MGMGGDLAYQWLDELRGQQRSAVRARRRGCAPEQGQRRRVGRLRSGIAGRAVVLDRHGRHDELDRPRRRDRHARDGSDPRRERRLRSPSSPSASAPRSAATRAASPRSRPRPRTSTPPSRRRTPWARIDYLVAHSNANVPGKVINVPGCPTNPWWFVLSVVCFLVDIPSILGQPVGTVGTLGVLKESPPTPTTLWVSASTWAAAWTRLVASRPSTATRSTARTARATATTSRASTPASPAIPVACRRSVARARPPSRSADSTAGTTSSRPTPSGWDYGVSLANPAPNGTTMTGGHCTRAGHPCMACTEKGYPDSFVPFVVR